VSDTLTEQTARVRLVAVSRESLPRFLLGVQQLNTAITTRTLLISPNRKQPALLDAEVAFSAYEATATASK